MVLSSYMPLRAGELGLRCAGARGDRYGHFAPTPMPSRDFDPPAVEFRARAAKAMRDVLYAGAERKPQRL